MQITNDANLPEPLYQVIVAQQHQHSVGEADISCTQLIDAPLIAWMWRNYGEQVVEDAADRLWALYGSFGLPCRRHLLTLFWKGMPELDIMWGQRRFRWWTECGCRGIWICW